MVDSRDFLSVSGYLSFFSASAVSMNCTILLVVQYLDLESCRTIFLCVQERRSGKKTTKAYCTLVCLIPLCILPVLQFELVLELSRSSGLWKLSRLRNSQFMDTEISIFITSTEAARLKGLASVPSACQIGPIYNGKLYKPLHTW